MEMYSSKNVMINADSYFDLTRCVIENKVKDEPNFIKHRLEGRELVAVD